jgi:hypothetical protein
MASLAFEQFGSYNLKHNASISASRISKTSTRTRMMAVKNSEIDCFCCFGRWSDFALAFGAWVVGMDGGDGEWSDGLTDWHYGNGGGQHMA